MKTININAYKVSNKIELNNIIGHFGIKKGDGWSNYVMLSTAELSEMLKCDFDDKTVYIYECGVITFVNFNNVEIGYVMKYLSDLYIDIDYTLFENYSDIQTIVVDGDYFTLEEDESFRAEYSKDAIGILSFVLVKSLEIEILEQHMDKLLDETEKYLDYMSKAKVTNLKSTAYLNTKIIDFNFRSIRGLGIYFRPIEIRKHTKLREVYDKLYAYFEIAERLAVIKDKSDEMKETSKNYMDFSFSRQTMRSDIALIILLLIFPIMRLIDLVKHWMV